MARPLRIEYPGAIYHVTSRGNERKEIFHDDNDREVFLDILHNVTVRYQWLCHAYCLMDNHYHSVIETPEGNLSIGMRQLNGVYTQMINKKYQRVGHLFQGRFKGILVQKDSYLLAACRYVVLNPVRAKIVEDPAQWAWSSYPATAGLEKAHPCLTRQWILSQFAGTEEDAERAYQGFVKEGMEAGSLWGDLRGQSLLGDEGFAEGLTEHVRGRQRIVDIPKSARFLNRPTLQSLLKKDGVMDKRTRDGKIAEAIQEHGYTQKEVADHLGLHYSSISRIMKARP